MSTNANKKALKIFAQAVLATGVAGFFGQVRAEDDDPSMNRYRNKNRPVYQLYKGHMNEELNRAKLNLPAEKSKPKLKGNPFAGTIKQSETGPEGDFIPDDLRREQVKPKPMIKAADFQLKEDTRSFFEDPRFDEKEQQDDGRKEEILDWDNLTDELIQKDLDGVVIENGELELDSLDQDERENNTPEDPNIDPDNPDANQAFGGKAWRDEEDPKDQSNGFTPALSGKLGGEQPQSSARHGKDTPDAFLLEQPLEQVLESVVEDNSLVVGEQPDAGKKEEALLSRSQDLINSLVSPHREARDKKTERSSGFDRLVNRYDMKNRKLADKYTPGKRAEAPEPKSAVVKVSPTDQNRNGRVELLRDSTQFNETSRTLNGKVAFQPSTRFQPTSDVDFNGRKPPGLAGLAQEATPAVGGRFGSLDEPTTPGVLRLPRTVLNNPVQPRPSQTPLFNAGGTGGAPAPGPSFRETRREGLRLKSMLGTPRQTFPLGNRGF